MSSSVRVGTLRVGTLRVGSLGVGTLGVGTLGVGTPGVGTLRVGTLCIGTLGVGTLRIGTPGIGTLGVGTLRIGTLGIGTLSVGTLRIGTLGVGTIRRAPVVGASDATIIGRARCRRRVEGVSAVCAGALGLNDGPCSVLTRRRRVVAQVCDHTESHDESAHDPHCLTSHRTSPGFVVILSKFPFCE